jgi:hypothetical protein
MIQTLDELHKLATERNTTHHSSKRRHPYNSTTYHRYGYRIERDKVPHQAAPIDREYIFTAEHVDATVAHCADMVAHQNFEIHQIFPIFAKYGKKSNHK